MYLILLCLQILCRLTFNYFNLHYRRISIHKSIENITIMSKKRRDDLSFERKSLSLRTKNNI